MKSSDTKLAFRSGRKAISSIRTDAMPAAITPTSATTMNGAPMAVAASIEYPVIVTSSP